MNNPATGHLRKKASVETDVYTLALERTEYAMRRFDRCVVSFSGGKDSTAVLNIAIEVARKLGKLPVEAIFFDEEAISPLTEHYVRRVYNSDEVRLKWVCLPVKHRNACSRKNPFWYPWAPEDQEKWVRPMPPEATTLDDVPRYPRTLAGRPTIPEAIGLFFPRAEYGDVGMMMGIRGDESITRLMAILAKQRETKPYLRRWEDGYSEGNLIKVYPIYDWTTQDVWTAPQLFGWDHNETYDLYEKAGVSRPAQRVAPPFGEEPLQNLWTYHECFPELWDKMSRRVPGVNTALMYSKTELYSFDELPEKPGDVSWEQFIAGWIEKHPPQFQKMIADSIRRLYVQHQIKAPGHPLAISAPHPYTGVSWGLLLKKAVRGDYKGRKMPNYTNDRARYVRELIEMGETPPEFVDGGT